MRFTHDDKKQGFFHELTTELRNDVVWVIHRRTSHQSGQTETESRMSFGNLESMFSSAVTSILNPCIARIA